MCTQSAKVRHWPNTITRVTCRVRQQRQYENHKWESHRRIIGARCRTPVLWIATFSPRTTIRTQFMQLIKNQMPWQHIRPRNRINHLHRVHWVRIECVLTRMCRMRRVWIMHRRSLIDRQVCHSITVAAREFVRVSRNMRWICGPPDCRATRARSSAISRA